jgi:hypothetical protein
MANVNVLIDTLTDANPSGERTGTYSEGPGTPNWASVGTNGDINLNTAAHANVSIFFTLPAGYTFASTSAFTTDPTSTDFSVTFGESTQSLTVSDTNNDPVAGTEYSYTLNLSDGTKIDPKVINY